MSIYADIENLKSVVEDALNDSNEIQTQAENKAEELRELMDSLSDVHNDLTTNVEILDSLQGHLDELDSMKNQAEDLGIQL